MLILTVYEDQPIKITAKEKAVIAVKVTKHKKNKRQLRYAIDAPRNSVDIELIKQQPCSNP